MMYKNVDSFHKRKKDIDIFLYFFNTRGYNNPMI